MLKTRWYLRETPGREFIKVPASVKNMQFCFCRQELHALTEVLQNAISMLGVKAILAGNH